MCISDLSSCNLIGLASSLAILIAQDLDTDDVTVLSAFFSALGDNLALIASTPTNSLQADTSSSTTLNSSNSNDC